MRKRSGGARQRIWNALMIASRPMSLSELVEASAATDGGARSYLHGLNSHGYLDRPERGFYVLTKKTGPEAPAYSAKSGEFHDWNLNPVMTTAELKRAVDDHGGSLAAFCRDIGLSGNTAGHVAKMLRGQKHVTTEVDSAVRAWLENRP